MGRSRSTTNLESAVIAELSAGGRVLVSRLEYLGDVILSLPMVAALRERFPQAQIDYMTREDGVDVLHGEPMFSEVIRVPKRSEGNLAMWRLVRRLRRRRYALAIDLYSNPRSALLAWLSGAKLRIGGDRRLRRHLYTHATRVPDSIRAATDHHLHFLEPLRVAGKRSRPVLTISKNESERARNILDKAGVRRDAPTIGVHPGGKWEVKRWPVASFAELSARLIDRHGMQVVVFCGPGEERYRDALRQSLAERGFYLPTLTIRETAGVIDALGGMVVCDGGIMHVSVAVNTPTVGIFGSSETDIWFPYEEFGPFVPAYVPIECRPCHSHVCSHISCLRDLTVDSVERKLLDVIDHPGSAYHSTRS